MLSFEEFFIKKKIDLFALKSANQELYNEFEVHYQSMGEKSFDHSKKFWFNRLRKSYLLTEEITLPTASLSDSQSMKTNANLGVKPQFSIKSVSQIADKSEDEPETATTAPARFKPRFKSSITKSIETDTTAVTPDESSGINAEEITNTKPAGFKPRFKAGVTKNTPPADNQ